MKQSPASKSAFKRAAFLTEEQEVTLTRAARAGDRISMERLIRAYEPFAHGMAFRHKSQLEVEDRKQIAMAALWQAAERFNPDAGVRLSAYAKFRIRRDLDDAGSKAASRLNLGNGKQRRAAHQNVLRVCNQLDIDPTETLTDDQASAVAAQIGISVTDVRGVTETGEASFSGRVDDLIDENDTAELFEMADYHEKMSFALSKAIDELDEMDADIIRLSVMSDEPVPVSRILEKHGSKLRVAKARQNAMSALRGELAYAFSVLGLTDQPDYRLTGPAAS